MTVMRTGLGTTGAGAVAVAVAVLGGLASVAAGCGSGGSSKTGSGLSTDALFAVCANTPAVDVKPGIAVTSASGSYTATLQSATTTDNLGHMTTGAGIGLDVFTIAVTANADGGAATAADGVIMTIPTDVTDPYMPIHGHGGGGPVITTQGGGTFAVSNLDFFMAGWWQLYLDAQPAAGAAKDRVTFDICIPDG